MRNFRPSLFGWLIFSVFCIILSGLSGTIDAQEEVTETPTAEPSVTLTPTPIPFSLTIFRDTDSFTLYAPAQGDISLVGFTFAVSDKIYALENFGSFRGMPFGRLPTPICFRLARSGSSSPLPLECMSALILTQMLSNADIFWYDSVLVQDFVVLIQREGETQGICASGQAACDISFAPREATPTPTASATSPTSDFETFAVSPTPSAILPTETSQSSILPTLTSTLPPPTPTTARNVNVNTATPTPTVVTRMYPCEATVMLRGSDASSIGGAVYSQPRLTSTSLSVTLRVGQTLEIRRDETTGNTRWYQIANPGGGLIGWTTAQYLDLSPNCPS